MNEEPVTPALLASLRSSGTISSNEVIYLVGDLYVAENVITKARRVLENVQKDVVEGKKILKG
jgi:calcineurin-like phosphoesterase family protein